jgi:AcrR family transcriptional regulator
MIDETTGAVDKRVQRSKQLILTTTYELLSEAGIDGVSVDEVSRRSGVSKTTIYRHWPSRSALLMAACSQAGPQAEVPNTGSLKGDIAALAVQLADQLRSARWAAILPSIIDSAERDPELAELHRNLHADLMAPYIAIAERAIRRKELVLGLTPADVAAAIVAPLFYRRWFSREPIDDQFVKRIIRNLVGELSRNARTGKQT